ncbi:MAG: hypothetical protein ACREA9_07440 [Pyrinomonadaceae bacterium]
MLLTKPPVNDASIEASDTGEGTYVSAGDLVDAVRYEFRNPFSQRIRLLVRGGRDQLSHLICNP